jgi:hypothetical protein
MMGARLVRKAIEQWPDLTDRQHRVLTTMAFTARDDDPRPVYFKGRDFLVSTLGMAPGTDASYESVRKVVASLVKRGAVARLMFGHNGRNTVYELTLDRDPRELLALPHGAPTAVDNPAEPDGKTHPDSAPVDPLSERCRGTVKAVKALSHSAPKEQEEEEDEYLGGKSPSKVTSPSGHTQLLKASASRLEELRRLEDARSAS